MTVVTTVRLVFSLDWRLALLSLAGLPIAVIPGADDRQAYRARQETQEKSSELTVYLQKILGISDVRLVKAFARERCPRDFADGVHPVVGCTQIRRDDDRAGLVGCDPGLFEAERVGVGCPAGLDQYLVAGERAVRAGDAGGMTRVVSALP